MTASRGCAHRRDSKCSLVLWKLSVVVLVMVVVRSSLSVKLCSALSSSSPSLSNTYREIALQSIQLDRWPNSQKLWKEILVYDKGTKGYRLPTFPDGHGPLGVFSFLGRNTEARSIMTACDEVFATFCEQVVTDILLPNHHHNNDNKKEAIQQRQDDFLSNWVFRSPPQSHHISVAIIQEHPSLLRDPEDLAKWRPLTSTTIQHLGQSLAEEHGNYIPAPRLTLDSLLWTPDGALIAGFIEDDNDDDGGRIKEGGHFASLRESSRNIARRNLGDILTSRPKNLIHATVGRVIGLPPGAVEVELRSLTDLARHYNKVILPATVQDMKHNHPNGCSFYLEEVSLARNIRWMLFDYKEYATWSLAKETKPML